MLFEKYKQELKNKGAAYLRIKVIPGAPKTEIKGEMADGTIKISIKEKAEKGRANSGLARFLAREFGTTAGGVKIISGAADRIKLIKIIWTKQE